jgi:hypothetical protein
MSLVEPNSFYRDQIENLDESFLKEIQGKSAWSTRSSLCISERESYHKTDTEEESADDSGNERNDSDAWSLGSMMQEAIMVRERYHSLYA